MSAPTVFRSVNSNINIKVFIVSPFFSHFFVINQISGASCTVKHINMTVVISVCSYIVYYRTQWSDTNTTCNKKQILFSKSIVYRERLSVRSANCNFVPNLKLMNSLGQNTASFDRKLFKLSICRR